MLDQSKPLISVVLPVHNGERYLQACIESVLAQTTANSELLVGDDGSSDGSARIIDSFTDPRIKVITRERNLGLFQNLNDLLRRVRADYVHILCQDDRLMPSCLEEEVQFMLEHPSIAFCYTKTIRIDGSGWVMGKCSLHDVPEVIEPDLGRVLFFFEGCIPGNLSTVCAKTAALADANYFDECFGVSGDYDLWARLVERYPMGVIHKHLIGLRQHAGQLSRVPSSGLKFIRENRKIRARLFASLPQHLRGPARHHSLFRHNVLDVHYAMRCLTWKRWGDFCKVVKALGLFEFVLGCLAWVMTLNNHAYHPHFKLK